MDVGCFTDASLDGLVDSLFPLNKRGQKGGTSFVERGRAFGQ